MKRTPLNRRTELKPGAKSLERGSTFKADPKPLARHGGKPRRHGFTPASTAQREAVHGRGSIVSGDGPCDPAHVTPRSHGGCDSPLCVIPLTRPEHRAFDDGRLDVLPHMIAHNLWAEIAHAIEAHRQDPISLLQRLTGQRWQPTREENP